MGCEGSCFMNINIMFSNYRINALYVVVVPGKGEAIRLNQSNQFMLLSRAHLDVNVKGLSWKYLNHIGSWVCDFYYK